MVGLLYLNAEICRKMFWNVKHFLETTVCAKSSCKDLMKDLQRSLSCYESIFFAQFFSCCYAITNFLVKVHCRALCKIQFLAAVLKLTITMDLHSSALRNYSLGLHIVEEVKYLAKIEYFLACAYHPRNQTPKNSKK